MMREIKFRAKIVMDVEPLAMEKGDWVEGHYYEDLHQGEWCSWIQECNDITHYKVDKNTLGQFTGLLDKNGKEIYEGDIVKAPLLDPIFEDILIKDAFTEAVVKYNNGAFVVSYYNESHNIYIQDLYKKIEVIGNIHDNPELLKGGAE